MKSSLVFACCLILALALGARVFAQDIPLGQPQTKAGVDLLDAIGARVATHNFVSRALPVSVLSTILWAANGMRGPDAVTAASKAGRTIAYSGDNAYLNLYLFNADGVYLYDPQQNVLKQRSKGDKRSLVTVENIPAASAMLLFTFDSAKAPPFLKSLPRLVHDIAESTAGYAAENMMLAAAAFKLGSIVMFNVKPADSFAAVANLTGEESPLFIVQIGYTQ